MLRWSLHVLLRRCLRIHLRRCLHITLRFNLRIRRLSWRCPLGVRFHKCGLCRAFYGRLLARLPQLPLELHIDQGLGARRRPYDVP